VAPSPNPHRWQIPDETAAEARDSEVLLTEEERNDLQTALEWFGFYQGKIDGAFRPRHPCGDGRLARGAGVLDRPAS
jgi:hypothetical protein